MAANKEITTARTEFRPCIDLHAGKVKQIVGSTLNTESGGAGHCTENFVAPKGQDSQYFARLYKQHGLRGGHVIMLGSGNADAALAAVKAYPGGLQVRSDDAELLLSAVAQFNVRKIRYLKNFTCINFVYFRQNTCRLAVELIQKTPVSI